MSNKNRDENDVDCSCYALSRNKKSCPPVRNVTHPLRYYEFTPEEMKALEECDKESFYHRCLPFSTLFATLTYAGIKHGENLSILINSRVLLGTPRKLHRRILNQSPHFGVVPKVALAAFLGHCYGRLSFIPECEARLRRLSPQSHLGNVMRQYYFDKNPPKDCKKK